MNHRHTLLLVAAATLLPLPTLVAQTYTYDENGRLLAADYGLGPEMAYGYDDEGSLSGTVQDSDADGMSDEFEQHIIDFKANDGVTSFEDVNATTDFNGDGTTDLQHFTAGTSPTTGQIPVVPEPAAGALLGALLALLTVLRCRRSA